TIASFGNFGNEVIRHKTLDAVGDFCGLLGRPIKGHIIVIEGGHRDHIAMAKRIKEVTDDPQSKEESLEALSEQERAQLLSKLEKMGLDAEALIIRKSLLTSGVNKAVSLFWVYLIPVITGGSKVARLRIFDEYLLCETKAVFDFLPVTVGKKIAALFNSSRIISIVIDPTAVSNDVVLLRKYIYELLMAIAVDDASRLMELAEDKSSPVKLEVFSRNSKLRGAKIIYWQESVKQRLSNKKRIVVAIHAPRYHPYLGFMQKLGLSDVFIFYDNAQYERAGWLNRQRFGVNASAKTNWLTVPVVKGSQSDRMYEKRIASGEKEIDEWRLRHWLEIRRIYRDAPYFGRYAPFFKELYGREWETLNALNEVLIRYFAKQCGLTDIPMIRATHIRSWSRYDLRKADMLIALIKSIFRSFLNKNNQELVYLSGDGASEYLEKCDARGVAEKERFATNRISLEYQNFYHPQYSQAQSAVFTPFMSSADLLFNHGEYSGPILLAKSQEEIEEIERIETAEIQALSFVRKGNLLDAEQYIYEIIKRMDPISYLPCIQPAAQEALSRIGLSVNEAEPITSFMIQRKSITDTVEIKVFPISSLALAIRYIDEIVELQNASLSIAYPKTDKYNRLRPYIVSRQGIVFDLRNQWRSEYSFILKNSRNEIIGFAISNIEVQYQQGDDVAKDPEDPRLGFIRIIIVDKDYQGYELGKFLLMLQVFNMINRGVQEIKASVSVGNENGIEFLAQLGFRIVNNGERWLSFSVDNKAFTESALQYLTINNVLSVPLAEALNVPLVQAGRISPRQAQKALRKSLHSALSWQAFSVQLAASAVVAVVALIGWHLPLVSSLAMAVAVVLLLNISYLIPKLSYKLSLHERFHYNEAKKLGIKEQDIAIIDYPTQSGPVKIGVKTNDLSQKLFIDTAGIRGSLVEAGVFFLIFIITQWFSGSLGANPLTVFSYSLSLSGILSRLAQAIFSHPQVFLKYSEESLEPSLPEIKGLKKISLDRERDIDLRLKPAKELASRYTPESVAALEVLKERLLLERSAASRQLIKLIDMELKIWQMPFYNIANEEGQERVRGNFRFFEIRIGAEGMRVHIAHPLKINERTKIFIHLPGMATLEFLAFLYYTVEELTHKKIKGGDFYYWQRGYGLREVMEDNIVINLDWRKNVFSAGVRSFEEITDKILSYLEELLERPGLDAGQIVLCAESTATLIVAELYSRLPQNPVLCRRIEQILLIAPALNGLSQLGTNWMNKTGQRLFWNLWHGLRKVFRKEKATHSFLIYQMLRGGEFVRNIQLKMFEAWVNNPGLLPPLIMVTASSFSKVIFSFLARPPILIEKILPFLGAGFRQLLKSALGESGFPGDGMMDPNLFSQLISTYRDLNPSIRKEREAREFIESYLKSIKVVWFIGSNGIKHDMAHEDTRILEQPATVKVVTYILSAWEYMQALQEEGPKTRDLLLKEEKKVSRDAWQWLLGAAVGVLFGYILGRALKSSASSRRRGQPKSLALASVIAIGLIALGSYLHFAPLVIFGLLHLAELLLVVLLAAAGLFIHPGIIEELQGRAPPKYFFRLLERDASGNIIAVNPVFGLLPYSFQLALLRGHEQHPLHNIPVIGELIVSLIDPLTISYYLLGTVLNYGKKFSPGYTFKHASKLPQFTITKIIIITFGFLSGVLAAALIYQLIVLYGGNDFASPIKIGMYIWAAIAFFAYRKEFKIYARRFQDWRSDKPLLKMLLLLMMGSIAWYLIYPLQLYEHQIEKALIAHFTGSNVSGLGMLHSYPHVIIEYKNALSRVLTLIGSNISFAFLAIYFMRIGLRNKDNFYGQLLIILGIVIMMPPLPFAILGNYWLGKDNLYGWLAPENIAAILHGDLGIIRLVLLQPLIIAFVFFAAYAISKLLYPYPVILQNSSLRTQFFKKPFLALKHYVAFMDEQQKSIPLAINYFIIITVFIIFLIPQPLQHYLPSLADYVCIVPWLGFWIFAPKIVVSIRKTFNFLKEKIRPLFRRSACLEIPFVNRIFFIFSALSLLNMLIIRPLVRALIVKGAAVPWPMALLSNYLYDIGGSYFYPVLFSAICIYGVSSFIPAIRRSTWVKTIAFASMLLFAFGELFPLYLYKFGGYAPGNIPGRILGSWPDVFDFVSEMLGLAVFIIAGYSPLSKKLWNNNILRWLVKEIPIPLPGLLSWLKYLFVLRLTEQQDKKDRVEAALAALYGLAVFFAVVFLALPDASTTYFISTIKNGALIHIITDNLKGWIVLMALIVTPLIFYVFFNTVFGRRKDLSSGGTFGRALEPPLLEVPARKLGNKLGGKAIEVDGIHTGAYQGKDGVFYQERIIGFIRSIVPGIHNKNKRWMEIMRTISLISLPMLLAWIHIIPKHYLYSDYNYLQVVFWRSLFIFVAFGVIYTPIKGLLKTRDEEGNIRVKAALLEIKKEIEKDIRFYVILGVFNYGLCIILGFSILAFTSAFNVSLFVASGVVFMLLLEVAAYNLAGARKALSNIFNYDYSPTKHTIAEVIFALLVVPGVIFALGGRNNGVSLGWVSAIILAVTQLFSALGSIYKNIHAKKEPGYDPVTAIGISCGVGVVFFLLFSGVAPLIAHYFSFLGENNIFTGVNFINTITPVGNIWNQLLFSGISLTFYLIICQSLKQTREPAYVSILISAFPVFVVVFNWEFYGGNLTPEHIFGAAIISAAIALFNYWPQIKRWLRKSSFSTRPGKTEPQAEEDRPAHLGLFTPEQQQATVRLSAAADPVTQGAKPLNAISVSSAALDIIRRISIVTPKGHGKIELLAVLNKFLIYFYQTRGRSPPNATIDFENNRIYIFANSPEVLTPGLLASIIIHEVIEYILIIDAKLEINQAHRQAVLAVEVLKIESTLNLKSGDSDYEAVLTSRQGFWLWRLIDKKTGSFIEVAPERGNAIVSMSVGVNGKIEEIFWYPDLTRLGGLSVSWPFANLIRNSIARISGRSIDLRNFAGATYDSNGNIIHGLVRNKEWVVEEIGADERGIYMRSSFNIEDHPEIAERFGKAKITLIYRLFGNQLSIKPRLENLD
ncbi:MAG: hypothetical protein COV73_01305, partial [Candidatus Omnitrophica bacterium CG11_big_fil_rev_8_21_14_0_20_43_6]